MASTLSPSIQADYLDLNGGQFSRTPPTRGKRAFRAVARFLITFCIGVAATLAWQSYGDVAREKIANLHPQLGWLAPQTAPIAQTAPNMVVSGALSPEQLQLKATQDSVAAVRQSVDQLAAQFAAGQQQTAGDIANLRAAHQDILHKISAPPPRLAAPPARKPVPLPPPQQPPPPQPPPSSEAPPVR
jgi:hypothetical protein